MKQKVEDAEIEGRQVEGSEQVEGQEVEDGQFADDESEGAVEEFGTRSLATAVMVAVERGGASGLSAEESLDELAELLSSAGALAVARVVQRRNAPDPGLYVGQGKAEEVGELCKALDAGLVVFDDQLSPSQRRNLERIIGSRVIDRTQLILDIFAQRARTREGKLQVELAQLNYMLPRLSGLGTTLSRLGGGIGTRGPGESKLETDRRRIRARISHIREELEEVKRRRTEQRRGRRSSELPIAALVGYTNAGKSTLLNTLSGADVPAENRLFATLDPTIRRVELSSGRGMLLGDTVGFIRKLPHELVAAFRATLEEAADADLLIHTVDASNPHLAEQMRAVFLVLEELEIAGKPILTVLNKVDVVEDVAALQSLLAHIPESVAVSAKTGEGITELLTHIDRLLPAPMVIVEYLVPYSDGGVLSMLHEKGQVLELQYASDGIQVRAEVPRAVAQRLERYRRLDG